jgi:hypothetical protein
MVQLPREVAEDRRLRAEPEEAVVPLAPSDASAASPGRGGAGGGGRSASRLSKDASDLKLLRRSSVVQPQDGGGGADASGGRSRKVEDAADERGDAAGDGDAIDWRRPRGGAWGERPSSGAE